MDMKSWANLKAPKLGTIITIDHPAIVQIARHAGFDWLWIDGEHGSFNEISASVACAVNTGGPPVLVRIPDQSPTTIQRFLDIGCEGIIVPHVSTLADVLAIKGAALYPPRGERSIGITRAHGYGMKFVEYLKSPSYVIAVQIETVAGAANAHDIVADEAVDAVIIGPYDLSGSFGIPGEVDAPQVADAIKRVLSICKDAGKPCGIFSASLEKAHTYAAAGFDMIAVGLDATVLLNAWTSIRRSVA